MENQEVLIVGSVAFDSVKTPFGEKKNILGGSAVHASLSASFYAPVNLVSVVGADFPDKYLDFLTSKNINLEGLQKTSGKTFNWSGYYEYDMNQAHTLDTQLNVLATFDPKLSAQQKKAQYIFLANLDPEIQIKIINQLKNPLVVALDTMNYWIENKRSSLHKVIKMVNYVLINDAEARQFMETPNLPLAARRLLELGAQAVILKKGEHGACLFRDNQCFMAPSYPQEIFRDPTGAGDSFAGGFIGYLAKTGDLSYENIKRAVIIGGVMASFNIEDFSVERLKTLQPKEIFQRFDEIRRFSSFEPLSLAHWI